MPLQLQSRSHSKSSGGPDRWPAHATPEETAPFRIEGQAPARLDHPNIVRIYHCGTSESAEAVRLDHRSSGSYHARRYSFTVGRVGGPGIA